MAHITVNGSCILKRLVWFTRMAKTPAVPHRNLSFDCQQSMKTKSALEIMRYSKVLCRNIQCVQMSCFKPVSAINTYNQPFRKATGSCSQTRHADVRRLSNSTYVKQYPFYKFPLIKVFRLIGFFQIYQTGATAVLLPFLLYFYSLGQDTAIPLKTGVGLFSFSVVMLCILNHFIRHTVGQMCLSEDKKTVTISHLNFLGRRKDVQWPVNDIMPISETTNKPEDLWINLQRYSNKDQFYCSLRYGKILEKEQFTQVFGNIYIAPRRK